jgi:transcription antitermination factor NusG
MNELCWFVGHTKPRCEKKLVEFCQREGIDSTLPCVDVAHKYRGKTIVFRKPLFPGYVFFRLLQAQRAKVYQTDYLANLLEVFDQELFALELNQILVALETGVEIRLVPVIGKGSRVRIKSGPLRGMEAWVEDRFGVNTVLLRLGFIGQAAAVKIEATDLELV